MRHQQPCGCGTNSLRKARDSGPATQLLALVVTLTANVRATIRTVLEPHLRHEPEKTSRSRIKRMRGWRRPQYRLRVGDVRMFYDISGTTVEVLAIVAKSEAESWLAQFGNPE